MLNQQPLLRLLGALTLCAGLFGCGADDPDKSRTALG